MGGILGGAFRPGFRGDRAAETGFRTDAGSGDGVDASGEGAGAASTAADLSGSFCPGRNPVARGREAPAVFRRVADFFGFIASCPP